MSEIEGRLVVVAGSHLAVGGVVVRVLAYKEPEKVEEFGSIHPLYLIVFTRGVHPRR